MIEILLSGFDSNKGYGVYTRNKLKIIFIFESLSPLKIISAHVARSPKNIGITHEDIAEISSKIETKSYHASHELDWHCDSDVYAYYLREINHSLRSYSAPDSRFKRMPSADECFKPYDLGVYIEPNDKKNTREQRVVNSKVKMIIDFAGQRASRFFS